MKYWHQCIKENDSEISILLYIENFLSDDNLMICENWLKKRYYDGDFIGESSKINESEIERYSRKQMWFQEDKEYFCSLWKERHKRWESYEYDRTLQYIQELVQTKILDNIKHSMFSIELHELSKYYKGILDTRFNFNSCLVNVYENGNEGISPHRDCLDSFGLYPTIVGLSIGATRHMKIKRIVFNENNILSMKNDNDPKNKGLSMELPLQNNSVFIMMGASQKYYTHEIIKEPEIKDKRFSLTFRQWKG